MGISDNAGFGISAAHVATIVAGQTGASLQPLDLGRNYSWIVVRCADISHVAAPTNTLSFELGVTTDDTMTGVKLREADEIRTILLDDEFHEVLFVGTARRVRPLLSAAATGGSVVIEIYGIDAGIIE